MKRDKFGGVFEPQQWLEQAERTCRPGTGESHWEYCGGVTVSTIVWSLHERERGRREGGREGSREGGGGREGEREGEMERGREGERGRIITQLIRFSAEKNRITVQSVVQKQNFTSIGCCTMSLPTTLKFFRRKFP